MRYGSGSKRWRKVDGSRRLCRTPQIARPAGPSRYSCWGTPISRWARSGCIRSHSMASEQRLAGTVCNTWITALQSAASTCSAAPRRILGLGVHPHLDQHRAPPGRMRSAGARPTRPRAGCRARSCRPKRCGPGPRGRRARRATGSGPLRVAGDRTGAGSGTGSMRPGSCRVGTRARGPAGTRAGARTERFPGGSCAPSAGTT